jgi:hypothetical protein
MKYITILFIFAFLSACGGGTSVTVAPDSESSITGTFVDDPVQGLPYACSSGTVGLTNTQGEFVCNTGDQVTFHLGGKNIGTVTVQSDFITPYSFFPNQPNAAINLARLLQTVDTDGDANNGTIVLGEGLELPSNLDFSSATFDDAFPSINLVSAEEAKRHLHQSIINKGGIIPTGENIPVANAGLDQEVAIATTVTLDGRNSSDKDNDALHYQWLFITKPNNSTAVLTSALSNTPTYSADVSGTYVIQLIVNDGKTNSLPDTVTITVSPTSRPTDTTPPNTPTLTTTPHITREDSVSVEVNGELNANVFVNGSNKASLSTTGKTTLSLNTSGDDGSKVFSITLKDSANNESAALVITLTKDTTAPNTNAEVSDLQTDDVTPALDGTLPTGDNDTDTSQYTIALIINSIEYAAINNQDGTWRLADGSITALEEGFYDVIIIVTDEAGNETRTTLINQIEINNSGFLIDSALEGIKYVSGQYSGYTDANGMFKYDKDANVTFYLGDESTGIALGNGQTKIDPHNAKRKIITLFDLVGTQDETNQKVLNMGRLLQALDSDNDVSNGITLDARTKESIALLGLRNRIDFDVDVETFSKNNDIYSLFNDLAGHFGEHRGLTSMEDAKAHLVAVRDNTLATKSLNTTTTRGKQKPIVVLTGIFRSIGGVVEGLAYRSGNQFGRTNDKGEFSYEEGKNVKFFIYQLELGITQSKATITPADLIPATSFNHPKPRNIIRLLQAFDAISSDVEKITIDQAVRDALEKYRSQIDLNLPDGRANEALGIAKGDDEFGAQFEDFELGNEILAEILQLRAGN